MRVYCHRTLRRKRRGGGGLLLALDRISALSREPDLCALIVSEQGVGMAVEVQGNVGNGRPKNWACPTCPSSVWADGASEANQASRGVSYFPRGRWMFCARTTWDKA